MGSPIQMLGEIALRTEQLEEMQRFYAEVVGLELMKRFETIAFFKVADGAAGHTQILALFDRSRAESKPYTEVRPPHTTVDHLAFTVDRADFEAEKARVEALGVPITTAEHGWVQWRSFYISDPDQNTVEWVCFDPSIENV